MPIFRIPYPTVASTFTYQGSNQTFAVPSGVSTVTVYMWGAGGGGGAGNGGGGSSYSSLLTNMSGSNSTGIAAPGTGVAGYISGVAASTASQANGGPGLVIISYSSGSPSGITQ